MQICRDKLTKTTEEQEREDTKETSLRGSLFFIVPVVGKRKRMKTSERGERMEQKTIYYISEAARKVQVESHVLRYWEEELELPIMRNEMGHRYYTEQDIKQLQEIKQLKEQGLQLKAIRTLLFRMPGTSNRKTEDKAATTAHESESEYKTAEKPYRAEGENTTDRKDSQPEGGISEEVDIDKPQRFVVALSKEKEEPAEAEQGLADTDKSRKAARLQYLLQHMITEAVRSANKELCTDVKESILKELDYQFRMQEERDEERWKKEEEHYLKIDEMIRERHRPKDSWKRKKKSPVKDDTIRF